FVADSNTAKVTKLLVETGAVANGSDTNAVMAIVTDANGNPVANQEVTFSIDGGPTVAAEKVSTEADGTAKTTVTSTTAGSYVLFATVNGLGVGQNMSFTYYKATDINLSVGTGAAATGKDTNAVTAIVTDANGNPVANQEVKFSVSEGADITTVQGTTDEGGKATATVTSLKAGTYTVTAEANGTSTSKNTTFVEVTYTLHLSVMRNNALADGVDTNEVQVAITSNSSASSALLEVVLSATNGAKLSENPVFVVAGSPTTVKLTNVTAGISKVTAAYNDQHVTVDVNFQEVPANQLSLKTTNSNVPADGRATDSVQAKVTDANGNPVSGVEVSFSASNGAKMVDDKVKTGTDGYARANLTSTTPGTSTVTARVGDDVQKTSVTFGNDAKSISMVFMKGTGSFCPDAHYEVTVNDSSGNPVQDKSVLITNTGSIHEYHTTNSSGKVHVSGTKYSGRVTATVTLANGSSISDDGGAGC
ncbi:Ig-like domain-containing protein, partial [Serratia rhizosphaerae]